MTVMGVDPGFASLGWAIARLYEDREVIFDVGVIHTEKSDKKRAVRASDDNVMRAREIYEALHSVIQPQALVAVTAEGMSFPRSASVAAKMAMSWGVLVSLCAQYKLPIIQSSPKEVKKALTGTGTASKEEVQVALIQRYPGGFDAFMRKSNKGDLEHGFDAAATIVAGLASDAIQIARRMR